MKKLERLTNYFSPNHYKLDLNLTNSVERKFDGKVTINGKQLGDSNKIFLHAKDLNITKATINEHVVTVSKPNKNNEILVENSVRNNGEITLELVFEGNITDTMHGLYPSYFEFDGEKKELLATQFESHHAREVFPCIDEPEAKATFELSLVTETGVEVLSNMPEKTKISNADSMTTVFEDTPRMSTYLLAFIVGDLHKISASTKNGVVVNVWSTKTHSTSQLEFALNTAVNCIEFFDDYFGIPYPLPKSDHVALPDFSSGAMENWGLITYREVCLLVNTDETSLAVKEFVALVVCHELSHQWFGNLVTMEWWDDLWLNESFACLMEYVAVDALYPDWDIWLKFASHEALSAMRRDSLPGVQPVKTDVSHPDEISTLFDPAIVYAKGARLLYMLFQHLGESDFKTGLEKYFRNHAYKNTRGEHLWAAFSEISNQDVAEFMQPWLTQPGFPLVTVNKNGSEYEIRQNSFIKGQRSSWTIPLFDDHNHLLKLNKESLTIKSNSQKLVLINQTAAGYYSVRYEGSEYNSYLRSLLISSDIKPERRLLLLNDYLLQSRSGLINSVETLELLSSLENETSEPVWDMISLVIGDIRKLIEQDHETEKLFKSFVRKLINKQYERLGWDSSEQESPGDTKLRELIISLGVYSEDSKIIEKCISKFNSVQSVSNLPPDQRSTIISAAVKFAESEQKSNDLLISLLEQHDKSNQPEIRQDIASGLCATKNLEIVNKILNLMKSETSIRMQDVDRWFIGLLRNRYTRETAWDWLTANWNWIEQKFGQDKSYDHYPRYAAMIFSTENELQKYKEFFTPMSEIPALKRVINIGLNDIQDRVDWVNRDFESIANYLKS